jgi:hypothetical protein
MYNLSSGDFSSLGLVQERPSQGWGRSAQMIDPAYSTTTGLQHVDNEHDVRLG